MPEQQFHPLHTDITNLGWAWHGYCNCTIKGLVYKKNQYELRHYQNGYFKLKFRSRTTAQGKEDEIISTIAGI